MLLDNISAGAKRLSEKVKHSAQNLKKSTDKTFQKVADNTNNKAHDLGKHVKKQISSTARTIANKTK